MTTLYANDQTDLLSLNLNFWYSNLVFDEFNDNANLDGFEDNYTIYTNTNEALSLYGFGFARDMDEDLFFGTIEAVSQWVWSVNPALTDGGEWVERWHWDGWNQDMPSFWISGDSPSTADDLSLIMDVMSAADTLFLSEFNDDMFGFDGDDDMLGYGGDDVLRGNKGADQLRGHTGNDELNGGRGKDTLNGGRGGDVLNGNLGNDILNGNLGDDVFRGGSGRDISTGGAGADRFIFKTGDDKDFILDFQPGKDVVDLRGLDSVTSWNDLSNNHMDEVRGNVVIDGLDGDLLVIRNTSVVDLDENDFLI